MKYTAALALAAGLVAAVPSPSGVQSAADAQKPDGTGFSAPIVTPSRGGKTFCVSGTIAVSASAQNTRFNFEVPQNQTVATQTFISLVAPGANFIQKITGGKQTVSGKYQIAASLCGPANATKLQFLTHGVGFDRYYWDFAPGYSYVDVAAANGYATFLYDRLGVGQSEKADPLNVVQGPLEIAIAQELAQQLRKGAYGGRSFKTVVGAGHSYGSLITEGITSQSPSTFDAAILTGFSANHTGMSGFVQGLNLAVASQNSPARFGTLPPGYVVAGEMQSGQIGFFSFPGFDAGIAAAAYQQKATATYGEFLTQGQLVQPAPGFARPVAVVNGDEDLPMCFSNCSYPINKAAAAITQLYPNAKASGTYLAPNAGHGLNLHYSALDAYRYIQKFINSNGL